MTIILSWISDFFLSVFLGRACVLKDAGRSRGMLQRDKSNVNGYTRENAEGERSREKVSRGERERERHGILHTSYPKSTADLIIKTIEELKRRSRDLAYLFCRERGLGTFLAIGSREHVPSLSKSIDRLSIHLPIPALLKFTDVSSRLRGFGVRCILQRRMEDDLNDLGTSA